MWELGNQPAIHSLERQLYLEEGDKEKDSGRDAYPPRIFPGYHGQQYLFAIQCYSIVIYQLFLPYFSET